MKKLTTIALLFVCVVGSAQKITYGDKTITAVYKADSLTKDQIYSSINKWVALNYKSANSVIQMNDKEAGSLIVKGQNIVGYKNPEKKLSKSRFTPEYITTTFSHVLQINVKDGRYRIIHTLTDIKGVMPEMDKLTFNTISFDGSNTEAEQAYYDYLESFMKKTLVGKKKRAKLLIKAKEGVVLMNKEVKKDILKNMESINKSVKPQEDDDW